MAFSKCSTELRRFPGLLARKRLNPPTLRQGVKPRSGQRPLLRKALCPALGGMSLNSGYTSTFDSFQMGPAGLFSLFCNMNLEHSTQGPRHGGQASLSSELVHGSVAAQQRPWVRNSSSGPTCPKADPTPQEGAKATPSLGFQWASNETPVRFWGVET